MKLTLMLCQFPVLLTQLYFGLEYMQGVIEQISKYPNISSSANQDASNIINTMTADDGVECWCGNESAVLDSQSLPYDYNNRLLARVFLSPRRVSYRNHLLGGLW